MRIPVVFATDENYIFFTCVAISSLAKYAAIDTQYDIYILMDKETEDISFFRRVDQRYSNIHIQIIEVQKEIFKEVFINNSHITKATFYRLGLCELLDVEKCIYLDSDIISTEDLQDLFTVNIDDYYIAGCRDIWIAMLSEEECERRRNGIGNIPSLDEYINAGVMVMNLKKIKEDGMHHNFIKHLSIDYQYEDQDIINVCCYGKIKHLPAKWNIFTPFLSCLDEMREHGISEDTIKDFKTRKGIIHYATPMIRPWKSYFCWANKEWWDIASEWKEEAYFKNMERMVQEETRREQWIYYVQKCKEYKKIVVFGFTYYGKIFCDWLLNNGFRDKIIFCDNNLEKRGLSYRGIYVYPLSEIEKKSALFINCSQRRNTEVTELLLSFEIKKENIVSFMQKKWGYYQYLDERYYLDELKDIFFREFGADLKGFHRNINKMREELLQKPEYQEWQERYLLKSWILKGREK